MAFGTLGSTLNDELNRLANGGTYRDMDDMVDEALAAKQWANRENIIPYSTDTVGILNEIAALGPNRQNWFDFNGVCNYLAGTTGLPAAAALRQITTTGDILTSLASYYVDAATPRYNYPGYITLDGTAGNYISSPSTTALSITGDIDLRVKVALNDWTPATQSNLLSKYVSTGNQRSYTISIGTDGVINFTWSTDGTATTLFASTVATGIADGAAKWVRVLFDVDNGAGGKTATFYLSDDGTTWTQLGSAVTTAGTTSIYASTAGIEIGTITNGTLNPSAGKFYNAQIFAGLTGTDKRLDVDLTTNVTSATFNTFTATTGQLCTINGQDVLTNGGTAGSLLPTTVGSSLAADSNDAKFLDHTGTNYVYFPGVAANNISVLDAVALQITGDIDLRAQLALDDWTPAAIQEPLSKWAGAAPRSYSLRVNTDGTLSLVWSADGTTAITRTSTAATAVVDGATKWIRATLDVDNGASGHDVKFWLSDNGSNWTQLGTTVTTAGTTSIATSTKNVIIGANTDNGNTVTGKVFRAQIFNGIDGTKVLDVDTSVITSGADTYVVPTTYTGQAGAYFTGTGLSLPGTNGNTASTPDYPAIDITGDIDVRCKLALTDWTPASTTYLVSKATQSGNQRSYVLGVNTNGTLTFAWSTDGISIITRNSTVAPTIADGATLWVRAALDVNNGASGHDVFFYTSTDGTNWTQLGTTVTNAGTTSIFLGTSPLKIGEYDANVGLVNGTIYEAIVKSGIDGFTVFDADFTQVPANALRMTESSSYKAVVTLNTTRYATINRSTSGRKTVAVTQPTWLFGTDDYMEVNNRYMAHSTAAENYVYLSGASGNYMSVADNPPLDVTGDIDIRAQVALDDWTPASAQVLVAKRTSGQFAYQFIVQPSGVLALTWTTDGATGVTANSTVAPTVTDGSVLWVRATRVSSTGVVQFLTSTNGTTWTQLGTDVSSTPSSIYSGSAPVEIGSVNAGTGAMAKGKFYRAQILNGINGTIVLDADASVITLPSQTTFVDRSSNAYTVTINKSGVGTFVSTGNYLYLPGINSNLASASDSVPLDITGDIDVRVKVAADDWTPAAVSNFVGKWQVTGNQRSWRFSLNTNGGLFAEWSANGTAVLSHFIGGIGITDGTTKWVRWTLDVDNGASGNDSKFFTSDDGLTWTQVGTTQTTAGVTSIYNSTAALEIGAIGGQNTLRAKYFRTQILNGIGGTVAFDANFESSITSLLQTSFTESSTNGATVTIDRSGSTYRSAGVIDAGYLYPGATNTFSNSTTDFLNFGATQDFTVLAVIRQWNTPTSFGRYINKIDGSFNTGYYLSANSTTQQARDGIASNGSFQVINGLTKTSGGLSTMGMIVNRSSQLLYDFLNGTSSTGLSTSAVGSLSNFVTMTIGRSDSAAYQDFEFVGAAVFRTVLTAAQIRQVTNYFINREVYL